MVTEVTTQITPWRRILETRTVSRSVSQDILSYIALKT